MTKVFQYRGMFDAEPVPHRVCAPHGGHRPQAGYVPCERLSKGGVYWFPVYVPVGAVPAELRPQGVTP
jgi:hypothetical protein